MSTHGSSHDDPQHVDGLGHHIGSVQTYVAVFGSLLLFTALTYAVSFADLGAFALPIAMLVALVKATLVCTFFMHLKYDERFNVVVFVSSVFFIAVFFGFTLMDIGSRAVITETESYAAWWTDNPDARPAAFGPAPAAEEAHADEAAAGSGHAADGSGHAADGAAHAADGSAAHAEPAHAADGSAHAAPAAPAAGSGAAAPAAGSGAAAPAEAPAAGSGAAAPAAGSGAAADPHAGHGH